MKLYTAIIFFLLGCTGGNGYSENSGEQRVLDKRIVGKWTVVGANILPFDHISFCKNISLNSVFEFGDDERLKVFDPRTDCYCNSEMTQRYSVEDDILTIVESDMVFDYKIGKLTQDTLILRIDQVPQRCLFDTIQGDEEVNKELEEIKTNGINVTLVRTPIPKKEQEQELELELET